MNNNNAVGTNDKVEHVGKEVEDAAPSQFDPNRFPIVSNRSNLNYIAVGVNEVQEEILFFKNIMNKEISVNVAIKDCYQVILLIHLRNSLYSKNRLYSFSLQFRFKECLHSLDFTIDPNGSESIPVFFAPTSSETLSGTLTTRVHGWVTYLIIASVKKHEIHCD